MTEYMPLFKKQKLLYGDDLAKNIEFYEKRKSYKGETIKKLQNLLELLESYASTVPAGLEARYQKLVGNIQEEINDVLQYNSQMKLILDPTYTIRGMKYEASLSEIKQADIGRPSGRGSIATFLPHRSEMYRSDDDLYLGKSVDYFIRVYGPEAGGAVFKLEDILLKKNREYKFCIAGDALHVKTLHVSMVRVAETHRGNGYGGDLLDVAEKIALANKCDFLTAVAYAEDDHVRQNRKNSFIKRGYLNDNGLEVCKPLTPHATKILKGTTEEEIERNVLVF